MINSLADKEGAMGLITAMQDMGDVSDFLIEANFQLPHFVYH